jgi:rhomboid protease GluP
MSQNRRTSILCPNCKKLISSDELICPYCHIQRPGSVFKNNPIMSGMGDGHQLARIIIWVNVGMYILSLIVSGSMGLSRNPMTALSPSNMGLALMGATGTLAIDGYGAWWTLLTANYLHGGLLHIFFNMLMFWQLVPLVTREYGSYRMLIIYTFSGVAGFFLSYLFGVPMTIGASAAVCGLVGALLYFGKSRGGLYGQTIYKQVSGWVISLFIFGLIIPGINNWAHGGGILGGILMGWIVGYNERKRESSLHKTLAFSCAAVTVLVLIWSVANAFLSLRA